MEERRIETTDAIGNKIEGVIVPIRESREVFSDVFLEDGTTLKIKPVAVRAIRLSDRWDNEGNPIYHVSFNNVIAIDGAPTELKRKG